MQPTDQKFRTLLERYLNNTASPEERALMDRFFDSYMKDERDGILYDANLPEHILQGIHAGIAQRRPKLTGNDKRTWLAWAAVFSLFILACVFAIGTNPREASPVHAGLLHTETLPGRRTVVHLPDGTTVHLNSASKISYDETFGDTERAVAISGEAYFEVVKSEKPFIVRSGDIRTVVLGTSFNIKNRSRENVEVTLAEGKLKVVTGSGESSVLHPSQQAVIETNAGNIITRDVDVQPFTSWKDNILLFEGTSLKEAIGVLESWYAVTIDINNPALEGCFITAKYKDEPLGNVLSSFQFLLKLNIKRVNETHYTIDGTGCN